MGDGNLQILELIEAENDRYFTESKIEAENAKILNFQFVTETTLDKSQIVDDLSKIVKREDSENLSKKPLSI